MNLIRKVWTFFLNPEYSQYNYPKEIKRRVIANLLLWTIIIAITIGLIASGIVELLGLEVGENDLNTMFESHSPLFIFFIAIILAPIIEETIFRGPMVLFKESNYFPIFFYILTFLFGFVHLFNYESFENAIWFAPLLFLPQLVTGISLGYIRIRMGLPYSILFHALFNLVILGPSILIGLIKDLLH